MATNFPTSLDSFTNPSASDALDSATVGHASQHANINDAMVAVQTKLGTGAGTIGEWTAYTPTFTNLTVGNGIVDFKYIKLNEIVFVQGRFTLGSTSAVSSNPYFTLPVTRHTSNTEIIGTAVLGDSGTGIYMAMPLGTSTADRCYLYRADHTVGSTVIEGAISASSPMTWTTNDFITVNLSYRTV